MEQARKARDREPVVGLVIVHRLQDHITGDRLFTALVVVDFHAEEDVGSPLAVDVDVDVDVDSGIGELILLLRSIILLPHQFN